MKESIWGKEDEETLELLDKTEIRGKWLNLAAGDGRYNNVLLRKADEVVASDIDKNALNKLGDTTPEKYRSRLQIKVFDITKRFPFNDNTFDGVFCVGTLHLLPKHVFREIFNEMNRVLKPNGKIIIDFATDVKRISPEGKAVTFGDEPQYALNEAREILKDLFKNYEIETYESEVSEELLKGVNPPHTFSCRFILLIAKKLKS